MAMSVCDRISLLGVSVELKRRAEAGDKFAGACLNVIKDLVEIATQRRRRIEALEAEVIELRRC